MRFQLVHIAIEKVDAFLQGTQERILLFFHYAADKLLLSGQLRIGLAHFLYQNGQQLIHKGFMLTQEGVSITHGTAQDTANDITSLGIAGQLSVGNREGHGTQMVGHHAHGDVCLLLLCDALAAFARRCCEAIFHA